ncbi:ATP-dependent DNA helicase RecG [Candidatus Promineifilum breve]|uniref:ATP-dependent DNA helicase RecG n=2 Tax=Candidatus Promineifilum breve TaxID=1806508 RepID=A0A170PIZ3_9CHLR|nr:ATP-dependent DNA helicase RecG [Candidatus Promineifilum breve]
MAGGPRQRELQETKHMERALKRLERVLELEKQQGYQNKAVVGGIRQFAVFWVSQAREEAADEADQALAEQVSQVLMDYNRLSGSEARARAIDSLFASVERRRRRQGSGEAGELGGRGAGEQRSPKAEEPQSAVAAPEEIDEAEEVETAEPEATPQPVEAEEEMEPDVPRVPPDPGGLARPVTSLKGVGPKMAEKLNKLGVETIGQLLYLFPRRYDDYTLLKPISKLTFGEQVTIIGTIWQTKVRRSRANQPITECIINDGTGSVQATWFNQPWLAEQLPAGMQIVLSGKVELFLGRLVFNSPEWEPLELEPLRTRRIVPIYPLTDGLNAGKMREIMQRVVKEWAARVPDPLPVPIRKRRRLFSLPAAIQQLHFPDNQEALRRARQRLAYDELFLLQLGMQRQRRSWQAHPGMSLSLEPERFDAFLAALPFQLTGAQARVIDEIRADMAQSRPMNRLLQGDVGSGKTMVAAAAMITAAWAGAQAALMAPTEILAEQHYRGLVRLLEPLGLRVALLTGSTATAERAAVYEGLADGSIHIAIGTHALIQPSVAFHRLGVAIVDEQHRFGVDQRTALREKGPSDNGEVISPHLLVMSATPIPRTLALSLYGDLDLSALDEMPPGRQEIKTRWLRASERERAYNFVRRQTAEGRQAYLIYPLVEESESIDARAAVEEFDRLSHEVFPDRRVGLVHGRLRSDEKDAAMRAFAEHSTDMLVATSVIEVGVDVPNSTVIVIEGADRFGLAQLHQFRGRVGRGEHQSYCILIAEDVSAEAEQRLAALEATNDGFVLAERDLELRGPGEFFGRRQSGLPELRLASLLHDLDILKMAQEDAAGLFDADPQLEQPEHDYLRRQLEAFWASAAEAS